MGKHYPRYAMQHDDSCFVNFGGANKNSANWCAKQSSGIPRKTANLIILLTMYFLLKLTYFLVKSALRKFRNLKTVIHSKFQEPTFKA